MSQDPPASPADPSPIEWRDGQPRSRLFGDIYYSLEDGLAETRAVFLEGCGLPDAWAGRDRFTVAELGFGTGLNIAALLDLWGRTRPISAHLHIFSIEAHPLALDEAARALGAWPEIDKAAQALLSRWPGQRRGFHRLDLPEFSATFDLAVMDAEEALRAWSGNADAWFLDGFSPALNPQMWSDEVLSLVGARSRPGAVCATFTVAGQVRRGLAAAGFEVAKAPGHGRKRERLEARMPGLAEAAKRPGTVAIIGAGIAGASLSRALAMQGIVAEVFETERPGAGASGNAAALVTPAFDAGGGARAQLYAQAFARGVDLYDATPGAVLSVGAVQLEAADRDRRRFDAVAAQDFFEPGGLARLSPDQTARRLGESAVPAGLSIDAGRVVAPAAILKAWLNASSTLRVKAVARDADGWSLRLSDETVRPFDAVVLAAGWASKALAEGLALSPVRGQATFCPTDGRIIASASGAYAIPAPGGVLFGATHDRGETVSDVRDGDNDRNRAALAAVRPNLALSLETAEARGRASIRAATPDRMPLAGQVAPGLLVLSGLGSRGFTTAPLLAEHVAALIVGAPSPLPQDLSDQVRPERFKS